MVKRDRHAETTTYENVSHGCGASGDKNNQEADVLILEEPKGAFLMMII